MKNKFCGIIFKNNVDLENDNLKIEILKSTIKKQIDVLLQKGYDGFYIIYNHSLLSLISLEILSQLNQDIKVFVFLPYKIFEFNQKFNQFNNIIHIKGNNTLKIYNKIEKQMLKKCEAILSEKINEQVFINQKHINKKEKNVIFIDISNF